MLKNIYPLPPVTPPAGHPRLMLQRKDFDRIRNNMQTETKCGVAGLFRDLCTSEVKGIGATPDFGTYHLKEYLSVEAKALNALLTDDKQAGRAVIADLFLLLRNVKYHDTIMLARYSGHLIFIASEVYDWCYDWLTVAEREEIIVRCEILACEYFEMGYPPVKQAVISGHGTEAQLLRDLLAFSVAVYDERPDIYNVCAGRFFSEYLSAFEKVFAGEFHPQGPSYGSYRHTNIMWAGLLIYSMCGKKVLPSVLERLPDSFLYLTRSDGEMLRLGDDCNEGKSLYSQKNPFAVPLFLSAAYTGNRLYYDEAQKQLVEGYFLPGHHGLDYYTEGSYGEGLMSPTVYLIWNNLTPVQNTPALPCARYFGSPVGCTVYNDGNRLVLMKIGELWGANHDHLDTGCFQIYDGEILASDSGVYDSYHTDHRMKYYIHTVAHNCLLVGGKGTRYPYRLEEAKNHDHWFAKFGMAKVMHHSETDEKCEIEGDLSEAYSKTCRKVIRRMCWEPNRGERGILTVTDTVVPKKKDTVTFLLHCQKEPIIDGHTVILPGKNRSLVCNVKSPAEVSISSIGGVGRQFENGGKNHEPKVHTAEEAWGRVEITATGKQVNFCVEMEIRRGDS